jgi:hypothetical protein
VVILVGFFYPFPLHGIGSQKSEFDRQIRPKHREFALSVAVVDTRRVLRVRETIARGV